MAVEYILNPSGKNLNLKNTLEVIFFCTKNSYINLHYIKYGWEIPTIILQTHFL